MTSLFSALAACALAVQADRDPLAPPPEDPVALEANWELELLPSKTLWPPYLADPRTPNTGSKVTVPIRRSRDENVKIENNFGTYRSLAHWSDPLNPDEEAQLLFEAGVFSRFDAGEGWDMDAADYRFGFPFAYRYKNVVGKFHIYHITSHLGDEYISRVGRKRRSYHLDEGALAFAWYPVEDSTDVRLYAELGAAIYAGTATKSGRWQVGGEYIGEVITGTLAPFTAFDVQSRNEIDWDVNVNIVAGVMFRNSEGENGFRFTLEYYRGHDLQTQFMDDREQYIAIGLTGEF